MIVVPCILRPSGNDLSCNGTNKISSPLTGLNDAIVAWVNPIQVLKAMIQTAAVFGDQPRLQRTGGQRDFLSALIAQLTAIGPGDGLVVARQEGVKPVGGAVVAGTDHAQGL